MKQEQKNSAFVLALSANVMWASSFVGSKYTLLTWGPYMAVLLRFLLSIATLLIFYRLFRMKLEVPRGWQQWGVIGLVGAILGALYPLQVSGLVHISTGLSAAIMLLATAFPRVYGSLCTCGQIASASKFTFSVKTSARELSMTSDFGRTTFLFSGQIYFLLHEDS